MIFVQVLAIAYAVIGALMLYLLIATRRSVGFKIFMVVLVSGLYVGTYLGLKQYQGWPVSEDLPQRFRLHSAMIVEPDKAQQSLGSIYLWIQPSSPAGTLLDEPRAYHLPYGRDVAEKVEAALRHIDEGQVVEGQLSRSQLDAQAQQNEARNNVEVNLDTANAASQTQEAGLQFTALPRHTLPPKGR